MTTIAAEIARERTRLYALARYDILDTPADESFDRVTRLVRAFSKCRWRRWRFSTATDNGSNRGRASRMAKANAVARYATLRSDKTIR